MDDMNTFEEFRDLALDAWIATAPSYVYTHQNPLDGKLRALHEQGVTVDQFREAIELAFANKNIERRKCLFYAYGIIKRQLEESQSGSD